MSVTVSWTTAAPRQLSEDLMATAAPVRKQQQQVVRPRANLRVME